MNPCADVDLYDPLRHSTNTHASSYPWPTLLDTACTAPAATSTDFLTPSHRRSAADSVDAVTAWVEQHVLGAAFEGALALHEAEAALRMPTASSKLLAWLDGQAQDQHPRMQFDEQLEAKDQLSLLGAEDFVDQDWNILSDLTSDGPIEDLIIMADTLCSPTHKTSAKQVRASQLTACSCRPWCMLA